jgi:hypothetical protein
MDLEYKTLQDEIKLMIQELESKLNEHKLSFDEHQTWGHIGDLEHIKNELSEIVDNLN